MPNCKECKREYQHSPDYDPRDFCSIECVVRWVGKELVETKTVVGDGKAVEATFTFGM